MKMGSVSAPLKSPSSQDCAAWAPSFWHGGNYQDEDLNLSGFEQGRWWTAPEFVIYMDDNS